MTAKYNQIEYNRVTELFATIRKKTEQTQAIVQESERAALLKLLNDFEQEFEEEIQNKSEASFNIISADTIIHGHLNFLLETQKCIDVLAHPSYSLEFKLKSIEKLQESGESANMSKSLLLKANALFISMLFAMACTAVPAVPLIIIGGPIGIALTVAFYLSVTAFFYKLDAKTNQRNQTVSKLASKFMLFNSETHQGHEGNSCGDDVQKLNSEQPLYQASIQ